MTKNQRWASRGVTMSNKLFPLALLFVLCGRIPIARSAEQQVVDRENGPAVVQLSRTVAVLVDRVYDDMTILQPLSVDLGEVIAGVNLMVRLECRNRSGIDLDFGTIKTSCRCLGVRANRKVIPDGESTYLEVDMEPPVNGGKFQQSLEIPFTDSAVAPLRIGLKGLVTRDFVVPSWVAYSEGSGGWKFPVTSGNAAKLVDVKLSNSSVYKFETREDGETTEVIVRPIDQSSSPGNQHVHGTPRVLRHGQSQPESFAFRVLLKGAPRVSEVEFVPRHPELATIGNQRVQLHALLRGIKRQVQSVNLIGETGQSLKFEKLASSFYDVELPLAVLPNDWQRHDLRFRFVLDDDSVIETVWRSVASR